MANNTEEYGSIYAQLSPINSASFTAGEAQFNMNRILQPPSSPSHSNKNKLILSQSGSGAKAENSKRKYCELLVLPTGGKGKNPKKGSSESCFQPQQPKPKRKDQESVEELISKKKVDEDKVEDMQNYINMFLPDMEGRNWLRRDIQIIKTKIETIKDVIKGMESQGRSPDEIKAVVKTSLENVRKAIQTADEERDMGVRASQFLIIEETTTNELITADEGQGNKQTLYNSEQKYTVKDLAELEKKLSTATVGKVLFSHFQDLEEEVVGSHSPGEIPQYLQNIARKILTDPSTTKTEDVSHNKLILVYAAIHEMELCEGLEKLNWDRLSKWIATYNQAKDAGFQSEPVEDHLKRLLKGYLGFNLRNYGNPKETIRKLEAELEMTQECLSIEESFQGKPLSQGLFHRSIPK
ncbi:hypothetical protein CCACVL1_12033 [Corchorus capsularis]|uniref:Uncharacterized protein n=1 Tax=Corchorus capsularis TaxID=210143 RepID=A0A1R3IHY5_COCAP|nr:hypothetical protein CCACVL1_12033 [Corchorus capsularis]